MLLWVWRQFVSFWNCFWLERSVMNLGLLSRLKSELMSYENKLMVYFVYLIRVLIIFDLLSGFSILLDFCGLWFVSIMRIMMFFRLRVIEVNFLWKDLVLKFLLKLKWFRRFRQDCSWLFWMSVLISCCCFFEQLIIV